MFNLCFSFNFIKFTSKDINFPLSEAGFDPPKLFPVALKFCFDWFPEKKSSSC
jgi:hypothetical protein